MTDFVNQFACCFQKCWISIDGPVTQIAQAGGADGGGIATDWFAAVRRLGGIRLGGSVVGSWSPLRCCRIKYMATANSSLDSCPSELISARSQKELSLFLSTWMPDFFGLIMQKD